MSVQTLSPDLGFETLDFELGLEFVTLVYFFIPLQPGKTKRIMRPELGILVTHDNR